MNIGFIGLGNMGAGMATNLLKYCQEHGHRLWVFDLNKAIVEAFVTKGALTSNTVGKLARNLDVVFTSLPSSNEVKLVAEGDDGLLANLPDESVWFETSTSQLSEWRKIQAQAKETLTLIDAPVTGGSEGAAAGTLTMLLGVEAHVLESHKELLSAFTDRAIRMGPSGAGYVTKLVQLHLNYLVAQGIGEALMLGAKADLDLSVLHSVLKTSCAQSYVVDSYIPKVLDGSYDDSFALGLAHKDMRLISELGEHLNVPLPLGGLVTETYAQAEAMYGKEAPHLHIVKLLEDQVDKKLRA